MNPVFGNSKGYLLPMVIVYMVIAMIVGAGILLLGSLERIEASKRLFREQAFYLAEAGINYARFQLKQDSSWTPSSDPVTLGNGSFQLSETVTGDTVLITVAGTVKGVTERTSLTVNKTSGGTFSRGLFGGSNMSIGGSSQISGYDSRTGLAVDALTGSNSNIEILSSGHIYGDASVASGGTIEYPDWNPTAITGDKTLTGEPRTLAPITIPGELSSLPRVSAGYAGLTGNYQCPSGNFVVNVWPRVAGITAGDYHLHSLALDSDDQLTISGTVRLYIEDAMSVTSNSNGILLASGATLTIYMGGGGAVTFSNSARMNYNNSPLNLAIYVAGNKAVNLIGNCRINGAIYAPDSTCTISNSSELRGGIVADQVNLTGNCRLYEDAALRDAGPPDDPGGGAAGITFVQWTKPDWK